jgi:lauroyl/myristoyl acyltransferase
MSIGPGKLARTLGTPVCFVASVRRGNRYHISMDGPHHVSSSEDRDGDLQAFMQLYADFLERTIRENPENWVPFVKSWKRDLRKPATVSANAEHSKSFSAG